MRDIFEDIFANQPLDPMEAARRNTRVNLRKRFYQTVQVEPGEDGFAVTLDGRAVRTPARRSFAFPVEALAQAAAAEWDAQQDVVDPATMPLTRLANSIIDGVVDASEPVAEEINRYLSSDLLFYRAEGPEGLVASQTRHWDPILAWSRDALKARFILAEGVIFQNQPEAAVAAARAAIPTEPWRLGATHAVTTLTGSALLALALGHGLLSAQEAWAAAHVDEDWNVMTWGQDADAARRRAFRWREMEAAATILNLLR